MKIQFAFRFLSVLLLSILAWKPAISQTTYQKMPVEKLAAAYEKYKEPAITHRRFKHADIQPLIQKHGMDFKLEELVYGFIFM